MALNRDFENLLRCFNAAGVRYLVVGAYAVISYTEPRYTKDLDIWIQPERENAEKVRHALKSFGAPVKGLAVEDLLDPSMVYQIGVEPNRVDILMGVGAVDFDEAWKKRKMVSYGKEKVPILDIHHLIRTKRKAGRPQDKLDVINLKKSLRHPCGR